MTSRQIKVGITMGDPSGIGPEVIIKGACQFKGIHLENILVLGDFGILEKESLRLKSKLKIHSLKNIFDSAEKNSLNILNLSHLSTKRICYAEPNESYAKAALTYLDHAIRFSQENLIDAFVTAPLNKHAIFKIFNGFRGHTEYIAEKTRANTPVMLMTSPKMKVVPLTTHVSIENVPKQISKDSIVTILRIVDENLRNLFGIKKPRIAVTGLNPHSGEEIFGNEERDIIYPAIQIANSLGINAFGPYPADSIFLRAIDKTFDLVLTMFHDQALSPIKTVSFHKVVNITLGIPIIRTSVGHGVAYDIAGKNLANPESMIEAVKMALFMVKNKLRQRKRKSL